MCALSPHSKTTNSWDLSGWCEQRTVDVGPGAAMGCLGMIAGALVGGMLGPVIGNIPLGMAVGAAGGGISGAYYGGCQNDTTSSPDDAPSNSLSEVGVVTTQPIHKNGSPPRSDTILSTQVHSDD